MEANKPLYQTQCMGCSDYPKLLEWKNNNDIPALPKCCRQCYNMLKALEL